MSQLLRVAIDGNICSGKSTCLELLKKMGYSTYIDRSFRTPKVLGGCDRKTLDYHLKLLTNYSGIPSDHPKIAFYEGSPYTLKLLYPLTMKETTDVSVSTSTSAPCALGI